MQIYAPIAGIPVTLSRVPDDVFSKKLVGDGLAIDPTEGILTAPCDGEVTYLHPSHHALTLRTKEGAEILIHIGLETVHLRGEGFSPQVTVGTTVRAKDVLICFDIDFVATHAKSLLTQIVVSNLDQFPIEHLTTLPAQVTNSDIIFGCKSTTSVTKNKQAGEALGAQESGTIVCKNLSGIHARPAATLAQAAQSFQADILVVKENKTANAKSITSILKLAVEYDDQISVRATGSDAGAAINSLEQLIRSGLGEALPKIQKLAALHAKEQLPAKEKNELRGLQASRGLAMGSLIHYEEDVISVPEKKVESIEAEISEFRNAVKTVVKNLSQLIATASTSKSPHSEIFSAHLEILKDPDLLQDIESTIQTGKSAASALSLVIETNCNTLANLENEVLAGRAADLRDVGQQILKRLLNIEEKPRVYPPQSIVVARALTPSQMTHLPSDKVVGLVTIEGGKNSHVAIIARARGIPYLTGVDDSVLEFENATPCILDSIKQFLKLQPSAEEVSRVSTALKRQTELDQENRLHADLPAITLDGKQIDVFANIGTTDDVDPALAMGADGVGLLRSEFLFMERMSEPTPEEQTEIYQNIYHQLQRQKARPLVIRTLDVGGDKPLPYLPMPAEENPFLGVRGLRLSLRNEDLFRRQLRALLAVESPEHLHVMFPMVTSLDELRRAKQILEEERIHMGLSPIKVGIMVEVPSAALLADNLIKEVDFFSIGSNDLTQYTLAIDRGHKDLAPEADGLNPAVLKMIQMTAQAANAHQKTAAVCGGLASEPEAVPILIGLGVTELSVNIPDIPKIKTLVRSLNYEHCRKLAHQATMLTTSEEVRELLQFNQGSPS